MAGPGRKTLLRPDELLLSPEPGSHHHRRGRGQGQNPALADLKKTGARIGIGTSSINEYLCENICQKLF